jgi:hypothetical protein
MDAGIMAIEIAQELNSGCKMGLMPRQTTQDLQVFTGSLGGASAPPVCTFPPDIPMTG